MEPRDVLEKYSDKLLALPVRVPQFSALLRKRSLLSEDLKEKLKAPSHTDESAAQLFVDDIEKTLKISRSSFDKLISAMKEYKQGGMEELAGIMAHAVKGMYVHICGIA